MKKKTKTTRKTAKKAVKKKTSKKIYYTYNTPISVVEKEEGFDSGMPPNTKLGDYLKQNGQAVAASLLSAKF